MEPDSEIIDSALLWRYLLGDLAEDEREHVEDELFAREELLSELSSAEDDLIDSYVSGELNDRQRKQFESFFLSSPRRRERLAIARTLAASSSRSSPGPRRLEIVSGRAGKRPVSRWLEPLAAAAAVILIAAATVLGVRLPLSRESAEFARLNRQMDELRSELQARQAGPTVDKESLIAELRRTLEADPRLRSVPAAPVPFLLFPAEARRDTGQPEPRLVLPSDQHAIQLRLTLGSTVAAQKYVRYRAVVQTAEGAQVWGGDIPPAAPGAGSSLTLPLPAGVLRSGQYRILVSGITASGATEELEEYYLFRVASR